MIYTTSDLLKKYSDYGNPKTKINRLLKKKELFSLSKGIYADDKNIDPRCISAILSKPSYISFEWALAYYGLIPERIYTITCATFNKRKSRIIQNHFGNFSYSDICKEAYQYGLVFNKIANLSFFIATPEKALCDTLYKLQPVKSIKQLQKLLFNNLRIDEDEFKKLNKEDIKFLVNKYHSTNVNLLAKYIRGEYDK